MRVFILISLVLAACSPASDNAEAPPQTTSTTMTEVTSSATSPPLPSTTTTAHDLQAWFLVSVTGSLPDGLVASLATVDGVDAVTTASVGTLDLVRSTDASGAEVDAAPEEFTIPLEAQVFDPSGRAGFAPPDVEEKLASLGHGEALLSDSSAVLRRIGVGGDLHMANGSSLVVVGVVADEWVGDAEVVVSTKDAESLGITNARYAIVRFDGTQTDLDRQANAFVSDSVRVRSRDEVDVFRHADAVASQLAVKTRYGEFAYRPIGGGAIEIDPGWVEANILHEHIPLLGGITCHREYIAQLREVMTALEEAGHLDAIDRSAYRGCWNPRFIRGRTDLSHHAWGVAADINFGNDLDGPGSPTDPRLLEAMAALDILSGHAWTDPDPGHFEWFPSGR